MHDDPFFETARYALRATDDEVGPACMNVPIPPTIAMDDEFREAYVQGYRHALSDARRVLRDSPLTPTVTTRAEAEALFQRTLDAVASSRIRQSEETP